MSKVLVRWVRCALLLTSWVSACAWAQGAAQPSCTNNYVTFMSFNGIMTTYQESVRSTERLKRRFGSTSKGQPVLYYNAYNTSQAFSTDTLETFLQRLEATGPAFQDRGELLLEALGGYDDWLRRLSAIDQAFSHDISAALEQLRNSAIAGLQQMATPTPPLTASDYAQHEQTITRARLRRDKLVLFAHSQGNLFALHARNFAVPLMTSNAVKIVHVAPPTNALQGAYALADKDLVISAMGVTGGAIPAANVSIPLPLLRPADDEGMTDLLGHSLWAIYLNRQLSTWGLVQQEVLEVLDEVQAPPQDISCAAPPPVSVHMPPLLVPTFSGQVASQGRTDSGPQYCITTPDNRVVIGSDGSMQGTGCFQKFTFPAGATYLFYQAGNRSSEIFRATLKVMNGLQTRGQFGYYQRIDDSPPYIADGYPTTQVTTLRLDSRARMRELLSAVSGRPCQLRNGGGVLVSDNSRVEATGGALTVYAGASIYTSIGLEVLIGDGTSYDERHYDDLVSRSAQPPGIVAVSAQSLNGSNYGLTLQIEDENTFTVKGHFPAQSGASVNFTCITR